jgi:hypothetical protein
MSIVSSTQVTDGVVQADGSVDVLETHTDNISVQHFVRYHAGAGADRVTIMNNRATALGTEIADHEFGEAILVNAKPTLSYQTAAQFATRWRQAYFGSSYERSCRLSWWMIERINAGDVTDAQLQNAFGLTATQYNTIKTGFLIPQHDAYAQMLTSTGQ